MKRHYHLELNCPSCGADGEAVFVVEPPQRVCCADCLMEKMEVVEMTIVRCNVIDGQDGVDLFHHINFQRSTLQ